MSSRSAVFLAAVLVASAPSPAEMRDGGLTDSAAGAVVRFELVVPASPGNVWRALTDPAVLSRWLAPVVTTDLRIGGTIASQVDPEGTIGSPGTERWRIASALDRRLLVLRPEPNPAWPDRIRAQSGNLQEIYLLEDLGGRRTRLTVTLAGWGPGPAWEPIRSGIRDRRARDFGRLHALLAPAPDDGP